MHRSFMDLDEIKVDSLKQGFSMHLDKLKSLATRQGGPPNEFPTTVEMIRARNPGPDEQRAAAYQAAVGSIDALRPDLKTDQAIAQHCFALAGERDLTATGIL
jgi:hypothetical protein